MRYNVDDTVKVNKNIYRISNDNPPPSKELYLVSWDEPRVVPAHVLYASEGETGVIVEIFRPIPTGGGEVKALCAKVKIGDKIKTFRLTSLEIVE